MPLSPALPDNNLIFPASAASDPFALKYECMGIVFSTDSVTGRTVCSFKKSNDLVEYPVGHAYQPGETKGDYVFSYASPPPPPFVPVGGSCQEFHGTEYASLLNSNDDGDGSTVNEFDLDIPPAFRIVDAVDFHVPWECCSRCKQTPECRGFVIDRGNNKCYLKTSNRPVNIGFSYSYKTWT